MLSIVKQITDHWKLETAIYTVNRHTLTNTSHLILTTPFLKANCYPNDFLKICIKQVTPRYHHVQTLRANVRWGLRLFRIFKGLMNQLK